MGREEMKVATRSRGGRVGATTRASELVAGGWMTSSLPLPFLFQ